MVEFILFSLPSLIYVLVSRRSKPGALGRVGAKWGSPSDYGTALLLLVPLGLIGWTAVAVIPAEVLAAPGVELGKVASISTACGVILRAAGEEVFFRGLLGGVLVRRLGFAWGNLLQACAFLLPHLLLLTVDAHLWPILPAQFASGWVLGWLRHRSGSFLPGVLTHAVVNLATGFLLG